MKVWLDDLRDPRDYNVEGAIWVKTYQDFCELVSDNLIVDSIVELHFDNDLGWDSFGEGYSAFLYVEERLFNGFFTSLAKIYVHTSNPSAANKFMLAEDSMKRYHVQMIRKHY